MTNLSHVATLLSATPAFSQLSAETCARIAQLTRERSLAPGEYLAHESAPGDNLYLVVTGSLIETRHSATTSETLTPGQITGEISLLAGHPRQATLQAAEPTIVRALASSDFDQLCTEHPTEMASTIAWAAARLDAAQIASAIEASLLFRNLTQSARQNLAAAFVSLEITAGQTLFREGDPGNTLYLILSGRMRLERKTSTQPVPAAELGKGDVFGELALLNAEPRSASAIAIRDSHLAQLDRDSFDRLVAVYPGELLGTLSRHLATRLRNRDSKQAGRPPVAITVLPLSPTEQTGSARDFAAELVRQLSAFGPTLHLNRAAIDRIIRPAQKNDPLQQKNEASQIGPVASRRLVAWLEDLEMLYRHVVYEADYQTGFSETPWTSRCLRQADLLLMVAGGPGDPHQSEQTVVRLSQKAIPTVKSTLVLTHPAGPASVSHTAAWKRTLAIPNHEHVRRTASGQHHPGDVGRIARAINGQSVGLALGGGFALGLAHIGVVDAMRELAIPIDFVGGTSMGAIVAAACAQEFTHAQMIEVMEKGCAQALKGDYTLPLVALLTGSKVTHELGKYLDGVDIEDLWLPYFAISASLVHARMVVHRTGSALHSVVASCRAPGMFPPLGWNGDVLVDGGLVNNIPADVMRQSVGGAGATVIAIDVSPNSEFTAGEEFGTEVSGWQVARRNFNPFRRKKKMGTLADVLMRLIRLGGVAHNQQIRASADLYLSIPLDGFNLRDFHRGEELAKAGYTYALRELQSWIAQNGRPWEGNSPAATQLPAL